MPLSVAQRVKSCPRVWLDIETKEEEEKGGGGGAGMEEEISMAKRRKKLTKLRL